MAPSADAAAVVDREFVANKAAGGGFSYPTFDNLMTFTAGVTGQLTQVDIQTNEVTFTSLRLRAISGGWPTDTILATGTYLSSMAGFAKFSISFQQVAGVVYGLDVLAPNGFWFGQQFGYAGGDSFYRDTLNGPGTWQAHTIDLGFRTYVAAPAAAGVPEPATWGMLLAGFAMVGTGLRRRRTSVAFA